jgi:hypothetical protein
MRIRAHHLLCIPRFKGGGYDKKIRKKMFLVQKKIIKNSKLKVRLVKKCDYICLSCPFFNKNKCRKRKNIEYWINIQENKIVKRLKIRYNQNFLAKNIFMLSINEIKNKELKNICRGCEYLKYCLKHGINKSFIKKLKS